MKKNEEVYIVAEVGHNHKGSIDEAKKVPNRRHTDRRQLYINPLMDNLRMLIKIQ